MTFLVSSAAALLDKDEMIQRLESQLQETKRLYYEKDEEKQFVEFTKGMHAHAIVLSSYMNF